jgi:hypothetical protein
VKSEFPQFLSCSSVDSVSEGGTGTKVTSLLSDLVPRATEEVELLPRTILSHLFTNASH